MRLTKKEETAVLTNGLLAVLVCALAGIGIFYATHSQAESLREEARQTIVANEALLDSNRKDGKEIRFLRENAKVIEAMWSTLKGYGDGVRRGAVNPLIDVGLGNITELPPTKIPQNPSEYAGLRVSGDKTEFQRAVKALAEVEAEQGLMQVRSASMALPGEARPNAVKPTFLNIQFELVAPSTQ
jgi:hypothetical protein